MKYLDEIILEKREQKKKEKHTTLEDGIYMDGKILQFERKKLLGMMEIALPKGWKQMPKEYARVKYPSEFRPQMIMTTEDLGVNMGFTVFPEAIQYGDAGKITERMQAAIHRSNSDYSMLSRESLPKIKGSWFAFRSHAMDSDLYNMMLIASVDMKTVQGSFNCPYKDYMKWKKVVLMIWDSILGLKEV